jgi:hypothetical protein
VADHHTGQVHEGDYVGQSRVPDLRDRQHRGLAPQRDGVVREQPWADRIVGPMRILEAGMFTDTELDAAEQVWMVHHQSRLNCRDNPNPDRIPIYEQRRQRDQRDIALGLAPRDWSRPTTAVRQIPSRTVQPPTPNWARHTAGRVTPWAGRQLRTAARTVLPWVAVWAALAVALILWADMPAGQDSTGLALAGTGAVYAGWRKITRPKRRNRRRTR